jgi:hypothetical protein
MSVTIESVPEYLTREQYVAIFTAAGMDPRDVIELRFAHDGVHALVIARDEHGKRRMIATGARDGSIPTDDPRYTEPVYAKHRIFIPVRDSADDTRVARVTEVGR